MAILTDAAAAFTLLVAGLMVGTSSAFIYILLQLPLRVYDALGALNDLAPRSGGVALTVGMTLSTLATATGVSLGGPAALFAAVLALAGIFTGFLAAGLSEVLSVLPHTMVLFHLEDDERPLMLAVCLGKAAGAFLAIMLAI